MNWRRKDYLDKKVDDYMNREKFDYDIASDPAYQRYKEQYTGLGKMAAEDAMGIGSIVKFTFAAEKSTECVACPP